MRVWILGGTSVPFLLAAFLLASALVVLVPSIEHEVEPFLSSDWRIEVVSYHGGGAPPDIVLNSSNGPQVLHCPPDEVDYATREPSGWSSEIVFGPTGVGGVCGVLSLDPLDTPLVAFDRLAHKTGNGWDYYPVPWPPYDMAISSDGSVHITYLKRTAPGEVKVQEAFLAGGNWTVEDVDTLFVPSMLGSAWLALALDLSLSPHVLYYADAIGEVRYANRDENGMWNVEVVDIVGNLQYTGKHGSLALDGSGNPHAVYMANVSYPENRAELRYSIRTPSDWSVHVLDGPPGMKGRFPTIARDGKGVFHLSVIDWDILNPGNYSFLSTLRYATLQDGQWSWEVVYSGYQFINGPDDYHVRLPDFPAMAIDSCGNPHLAFYMNWIEGLDTSKRGVRYATKGEPCPPEPGEEPSLTLDIDPDTLNLKSKGRWVTAYLSTENASVHDIDVSTILLQDALAPERRDYQDDILMLKFNRQDLIALLEVGDSVEIKLTGKWENGTAFEACECIKVINPGK